MKNSLRFINPLFLGLCLIASSNAEATEAYDVSVDFEYNERIACNAESLARVYNEATADELSPASDALKEAQANIEANGSGDSIELTVSESNLIKSGSQSYRPQSTNFFHVYVIQEGDRWSSTYGYQKASVTKDHSRGLCFVKISSEIHKF